MAPYNERNDRGYQAALGFIARRNTEGRTVEYRRTRYAGNESWDVIEGASIVATFGADGAQIEAKS